MGIWSTIPKIAAKCVLEKVQPIIGVSTGAHRCYVNAKWILQIIMEAEPDLARSCLEANIAIGDMERP